MITEEQAQQLCRGVVELLTSWPALNAALQSGGLEVKASGLIATSLNQIAQQNDKLILLEYRHIDFTLIYPESVGRARLGVDSVIEVKFNYAKQIGEIGARLPDSIDQANGYRLSVEAASAYVLYFVAAPHIGVIPPHRRDSGWGYWNYLLQPAIDTIHAAAIEANAQILGSHVDAGKAPQLYCALLKCPPPPVI